MFIEIHVFIAICVDPDQTPRYAVSDLGLHCLPVSVLWDALHIMGVWFVLFFFYKF